MGSIVNKRLSGATIVEAIVALVIILVVFGIAVTILVQTGLSSFSAKRLIAVELINDYALATGEQRSFFDEEIIKDGFVIKKEVVGYTEQNNISTITFTIYDNNNKLVESQKRVFRAN